MKIHVTKLCTFCGGETELQVDYDAYVSWQKGLWVQEAFPHWPAEKREVLMTGTHPWCWDQMFWTPEEPWSMWLDVVGDPDQWRDVGGEFVSHNVPWWDD